MFPTAEVRWFFEGALPGAVVTWFGEAAGPPEWEERTDHYVRPACRDGLGVKWREGHIEVKRLVEAVGTERLHERAAGRVERWRKWRFPLTEAAELGEHAGDWVDVHKRRAVQAFAVEGDAVRAVASEAWMDGGCSLEVGEVRVEGAGLESATWWTVCCEASGTDEARLPAYLRRVAAHAFGRARPPVLEAARAMSYPTWLAQEGPRTGG